MTRFWGEGKGKSNAKAKEEADPCGMTARKAKTGG
jgi:hypothetical protein